MASRLTAAGHGEPFHLAVSRDGELYFTAPLAASSTFEISWIHSVEGEEWREGFSIDQEGAIRLKTTRFHSFGAGVPDEAPETALEDGWVVMRGLNRVVDPLIVRVNAETAHTLIIGGQLYPLPEGQYRFEIAPRNPSVSLRWEYMIQL